MVRKCSICGEKAEFRIKDMNNFYCKDCAQDSFGDVSLLVEVEKDAIKLKKFIESRGDGKYGSD